MSQDPIDRLHALAPRLDDSLEQLQLNEARALVAQIEQPLSREDIDALLELLPAEGDTAHGLNWDILHLIEAAPLWPVWELLSDIDHGWVEVFIARIRNGDCAPWG
ncbi:hypothetical protein [Mycetocola saprophilus]|uniref:hypothetical protein n=1 Tax=Mycetocola saprophilus TaxID=76636 RepID=UPI0004BF49FD|nr:hypothetical protein [Mycetocola saprophilus]